MDVYRDLKENLEKIKDFLKDHQFEKNDVAVFDIDETLIDKQGHPIKPVVDFYHFLKERIPIFIITARPDYKLTIEYTQLQLNANGITDYKCLYFRNLSNTNIYKYKLLARKNICDKGYNIVISIGDKEWDIGEYGGFGIIVKKDNS